MDYYEENPLISKTDQPKVIPPNFPDVKINDNIIEYIEEAKSSVETPKKKKAKTMIDVLNTLKPKTSRQKIQRA